MILPKAVHTADDLYTYALPLLSKLESEIPGIKLRLMGLRCTNLVSIKKIGIDFFGMRRGRSLPEGTATILKPSSSEDDEWEVWPEAEFEEAARQERQDDMNEMERLSQEEQIGQSRLSRGSSKEDEVDKQEKLWDCPICALPQKADDQVFNSHLDQCLSRQTIKEAVQDIPISPRKPVVSESLRVMATRNRPRGKRKLDTTGASGARKRPFFG